MTTKLLLALLVATLGACAVDDGDREDLDELEDIGTIDAALYSQSDCIEDAKRAYRTMVRRCPPAGSGYYQCEAGAKADLEQSIQFCMDYFGPEP